MIAIAIVETLRATSRMGDMIGWFDPVGVALMTPGFETMFKRK